VTTFFLNNPALDSYTFNRDCSTLAVQGVPVYVNFQPVSKRSIKLFSGLRIMIYNRDTNFSIKSDNNDTWRKLACGHGDGELCVHKDNSMDS
jgi:hypothetical protein